MNFSLLQRFRMAATPSTATEADFVPKEFELTFAPGETGPKSVEIDVLNDDLLENTEPFTVSLISSSVPAVKLGDPSTVNILDDDGKFALLHLLGSLSLHIFLPSVFLRMSLFLRQKHAIASSHLQIYF